MKEFYTREEVERLVKDAVLYGLEHSESMADCLTCSDLHSCLDEDVLVIFGELT